MQSGVNAIKRTGDYKCHITGADPGFQVRGGAHLKKLRRTEGGAKIFGVFRVKKKDFTPKNHIFFSILGTRREPPVYGPIFNESLS